jgi:hypothetical protein
MKFGFRVPRGASEVGVLVHLSDTQNWIVVFVSPTSGTFRILGRRNNSPIYASTVGLSPNGGGRKQSVDAQCAGAAPRALLRGGAGSPSGDPRPTGAVPDRLWQHCGGQNIKSRPAWWASPTAGLLAWAGLLVNIATTRSQ